MDRRVVEAGLDPLLGEELPGRVTALGRRKDNDREMKRRLDVLGVRGERQQEGRVHQPAAITRQRGFIEMRVDGQSKRSVPACSPPHNFWTTFGPAMKER